MISKPKILMFAPYCYPPAGSEAIVTSKLLLAMLDDGWEIDVICQSDFGHYYPVNENSVLTPVKKIIHNIPAFKNVSYFKRFKSLTYLQSILWTKKAVQVAHQLISEKKYNFILSRATPLYGHLPALIIAKKTGIPWIPNWSDPLPPNKLPPPYGFGTSAHIPIYLKKYCDTVAHRATWHTFPCDRLRNYVSSYLLQIKNKSSVIPHIALERFRSTTHNTINKFSMCHIGSLTNRDSSVFLKGVKIFLRNIKTEDHFSIKFIGPDSLSLRDSIRNLNLIDIVTVEDVKTYEEAQKIISQSCVLLVIEAAIEEGIFFPSKFVDYVQTGRPILAISPKNGTISDILLRGGGGISIDSSSPIAIAEALQTLYNAWTEKTLDKLYSSAHLFEMFNEKKVISDYLKIFAYIGKQ